MLLCYGGSGMSKINKLNRIGLIFGLFGNTSFIYWKCKIETPGWIMLRQGFEFHYKMCETFNFNVACYRLLPVPRQVHCNTVICRGKHILLKEYCRSVDGGISFYWGQHMWSEWRINFIYKRKLWPHCESEESLRRVFK